MAERRELTDGEAAFVARQRAARLATSDASGRPSVVPVCFAFDGGRFYTPVDEKPKRAGKGAGELRRLRNVRERGEAALLFDEYADDWSRLGYVLVRGQAEALDPENAEHAHAVELLRVRYPQYRTMALETRPVIALTTERIVSWGPALAEAGAFGAAGSAPWMEPGRGADVLPLARGRQSVRSFQARPVPREALLELLEAARWAPSPHGRQPWRFVVLTREEPKRRLAEAMGDEWRRVLAMDGEPPEQIARRLARSHQRIETAPALILACLYLEDLDRYPDADRQRAEEVMATQSLGAALQNVLLAAYALGLDTGWICAPLFCGDSVRAALGLDAALIPHALIPVGYKAAEPKRRPHRPVENLVVRFD
jgi:PPOX class probable F420-dependent enzyme